MGVSSGGLPERYKGRMIEIQVLKETSDMRETMFLKEIHVIHHLICLSSKLFKLH